MEVKEMKKASSEALKQATMEARGELLSLREALSAHQLLQVRKVRKARKQVARLKTFLGSLNKKVN